MDFHHNLKKRCRHEGLGQDVGKIYPIAERIIDVGISSVRTEEFVERVVRDVRDQLSYGQLSRGGTVMIRDLSKELSLVISAVRAVFERHVRKGTMHNFLTWTLNESNALLIPTGYELLCDANHRKSTSRVTIQ